MNYSSNDPASADVRSIQREGFAVEPSQPERSLTAAVHRVADRHAKIAELHPAIVADLAKMGRRAVDVIDPSPGLWGGDPIPGLVTVVYACSCRDFPDMPGVHTHHALYGPSDETDPSSEPTIFAD